MSTIAVKNPSGLCLCGCGQKTNLATSNHTKSGYLVGEPLCFVHGHHSRLPSYQRQAAPRIPRLCACGCGQYVNPTKHHPHYVKNHDKLKTPQEYVVEDRGHTTPCWIWTRAKTGSNYGAMSGNVLAHRGMYERIKGTIPSDMVLDHLCKNTLCVNPDHLEPVPQRINCRRGLNGKVGADQTREILASSLPASELARLYGVSATTIRDIRTKRTWAIVD